MYDGYRIYDNVHGFLIDTPCTWKCFNSMLVRASTKSASFKAITNAKTEVFEVPANENRPQRTCVARSLPTLRTNSLEW